MRYVDLVKTVEKHQHMTEKAANKPTKTSGNVMGVVLVLVVLFSLGIIFSKNFRSLFNPVSIVATIASPSLRENDGRINVLLLGTDRRVNEAGETALTDTLLFASIGRVEKNVAMISLPRDLWVTEHQSRINEIYKRHGIDELVSVVSDVLGMPIHYYAIVDFNLFKETIDTLGGVDIDVENSFVDREYPVEGEEASLCGRTIEEIEELKDEPTVEVFPCRYTTVSFDQGLQKMDGETALKYVRSRKGSNGEGTDFARSRRQQKVIMAIRDKGLSIQTLIDLPKLKELYNNYSNNVVTNIGLDEVQGFYLLSQQIDFSSVRSIVLDDRSAADEGGLLYSPTDPTLYNGAYVLLPKGVDYSQIHAYVQKYIFGE